jgi:Tfp pilus assembly protein PilX
MTRPRRLRTKQRGAALLLALFVMMACSMIVISTLDTQTLQYTSLRNTMDYDRARYLAEAAVQHALANLEVDYAIEDVTKYNLDWRDFPDENNQYRVALDVGPDGPDGPTGRVIISAEGRSGQFTRSLEITVKMGG